MPEQDLLKLIEEAARVERDAVHASMREHIKESQDVLANASARDLQTTYDAMLRLAATNPTLQT